MRTRSPSSHWGFRIIASPVFPRLGFHKARDPGAGHEHFHVGEPGHVQAPWGQLLADRSGEGFPADGVWEKPRRFRPPLRRKSSHPTAGQAPGVRRRGRRDGRSHRDRRSRSALVGRAGLVGGQYSGRSRGGTIFVGFDRSRRRAQVRCERLPRSPRTRRKTDDGSGTAPAVTVTVSIPNGRENQVSGGRPGNLVQAHEIRERTNQPGRSMPSGRRSGRPSLERREITSSRDCCR